jgi:TPR repeat protein
MTTKLALPLALCAVALAGCVTPGASGGGAPPTAQQATASEPAAATDGATDGQTEEATPSTLELVAEARRLIRGEGVPADPARAAELLTEAVEHYSTSALIPLGDLYRQGRGVEADPEKARDLYQRAITAGDFKNGNYALGTLYRSGPLRDPDRAIMHYERSASVGSAPALVALGDIYRTGDGVPVDLERAEDLYTEAEDAGNVGGTYGLGLLYRETDPERAIAYLEQAAAKGRPNALTAIADMYRVGMGVEVNPETARDYYERAIAAGDIGAPSMGLAALYRGPALRDPERALGYFEQAAATGRGTALSGLADMYRRGDGVPRDLGRARDYYEQALEAGDVKNGAYGLALLTSNRTRAAEYYERAAAAGNGAASMALAETARSAGRRTATIDYYRQATTQIGAAIVARSVLKVRGGPLVATLQGLLASAGYDPGVTDGRSTAGYRTALRSFCTAQGIAECDAAAPSAELVTALLTAATAS